MLESHGENVMPEPILEAQNLTKYYPLRSGGFSGRKGIVRAVEEVFLELFPGEVLGLVGESGCGKSTLARVLLRLEEATAGRVLYLGEDTGSFTNPRLTTFRRQAQIIYQDPYSALDPRMKIGNLIQEPLDIHSVGSRKERKERVKWLLKVVGLKPEHAQRYPHEFSGGQRQRIVIARALALSPQIILADEPVSALDVSIRAQVINLLQELQGKFGLTYIFISHDLSVVEYISDRVAVMYLGHIVEVAKKRQLYQNPQHPYTQALLSAVPVPDPEIRKERIILEGDVPSPVNPPSGCGFHTRCPQRKEECAHHKPIFRDLGDAHWVACHLR